MIYRLDHEISHISEEGVYDAELIRFPGDKNIGFSNPDLDFSAQIPQPMEFVGNLETLALTDFPYLSPSLPMMSWKLLNTLLSVADFPYRTYPTRIYTNALRDKVRYQSDYTRTDHQVTDPALYTERFVVVQLLSWTDVLDKERTIYAERVGDQYEPRTALDSEDGYLNEEEIERIELTRAEETLPGLFHIPELFSLLCTDRGVQACRASVIVGVQFTPIPVPLYRGVREVQGGKRLIPAELLPQ